MWSLGKVLNTPEVTRVYIGYAILPASLMDLFIVHIAMVFEMKRISVIC